MITLTALLFWLLTDDAFSVTEDNVTFVGLRHADEAQVRAHLSDLERAPNVFRVRASDIVSRLSELTEVDAARAVVTLPANVSVELDERDPLFIWSNRQVEWLVDETGMLFAPADSASERDGLAGSDRGADGHPGGLRRGLCGGGHAGEAGEAEVDLPPMTRRAPPCRWSRTRVWRRLPPSWAATWGVRTWRSCAICWRSPRSCWAASRNG